MSLRQWTSMEAKIGSLRRCFKSRLKSDVMTLLYNQSFWLAAYRIVQEALRQCENLFDYWRVGVVCSSEAENIGKQTFLDFDLILKDIVLFYDIFLQCFKLDYLGQHAFILFDFFGHSLILLHFIFQFIVSLDYAIVALLHLIFQSGVIFVEHFNLFFIHFESIDQRLSFHLKGFHKVVIVYIEEQAFRGFGIDSANLQFVGDGLVSFRCDWAHS